MTASDRQLARLFARSGFAFPITAFSADTAAGFRRQLESVEQRFSGTHDLAMLFRGYPHLVMPFVADIVRHPAVTGPVAEILGPDLLVWNASFFIKEPQSSDFVSWHQDLYYWGLDSVQEVTAWLALSPATPDNGCMRFVAGSHLAVAAHRDTHDPDNLLSRGQELAVDVDEEVACDVILQPGEMSLHHGRTFHASHANGSRDRRVGLAVRYISPSMRQTKAIRDFAMLARGSDEYGHFDLLEAPEQLLGSQELAMVNRIHAAQHHAFIGDGNA